MNPYTSFTRYFALTSLCLAVPLAYGCQKSNEIESHSPASQAPLATETPQAKNIILFVGDGMGISTVTAARIFDGQSRGMTGEEHSLAFEDFNNVALIKTYNINAQVPDSAGTATAIMSGYKTNIGTINVRPDADLRKMVSESCIRKNTPPTLTDIAKDNGMSVGVISTARLTHATPAAMYGHAVSRGWEADREVEERAANAGCKSLAAQLIESKVDIFLGGGAGKFTDEQIQTWKTKDGHIYVTNKEEFEAAPKDGSLLGLFKDSHMSYEADRDDTQEPSLAEMTAVSIDALSSRNTGYVLLVEAGRVDHAHHGTNAYRALRDMQALNEAVKTALEKTGDDTLILVTADHSHVFTMAGYPARGNPILGLVHRPDAETGKPHPEPALATDNKPYTTLGYHNGPNIRETDSPELTEAQAQDADFQQQTAVPMDSETHGGEDVPLYATGPGSQYVRGVMEQNEIHDVMMKALGLE